MRRLAQGGVFLNDSPHRRVISAALRRFLRGGLENEEEGRGMALKLPIS